VGFRISSQVVVGHATLIRSRSGRSGPIRADNSDSVLPPDHNPDGNTTFEIHTASVPEPHPLLLLGSGIVSLLGLAHLRRR
jgi:hypothetical protein